MLRMSFKLQSVLIWNLCWFSCFVNSYINTSYVCDHLSYDDDKPAGLRINQWRGHLENCIQMTWNDDTQIEIKDISSDWCSVVLLSDCELQRNLSPFNNRYYLVQMIEFNLSRSAIDCQIDIDDGQSSHYYVQVFKCNIRLDDEHKSGVIIQMALNSNTSINYNTSHKMIVTVALCFVWLASKCFNPWSYPRTK
ncbi:hypothetical protein CHUAL_003575 [Chamberlinius hualienensis]